MRRPTHVAVVGAGLAGLAAAHSLLQRGLQVTVLDAGAVGEGAGFANAGMLTPSMADPWNSPGVHMALLASLFQPDAAMKVRVKTLPSLAIWGPLFLLNSEPSRHRRATDACFALADYSLRLTRPILEAHGDELHARTRGTMKVFTDAQTFATQTVLAGHLGARGLRALVLTPEAAIETEPALAASPARILGAIVYPDDASADAYKFCLHLADRIRAAGGVLREHAKVRKILTTRGRARSVSLQDGEEIGADAIVVAAGARTPMLTSPLGVGAPIQPAKGYSLTVPFTEGALAPSMPVIDEVRHIAMTPFRDCLRVAGTAEFTGFDRALRNERIAPLRQAVARFFPALAAASNGSAAQAWCGFRPMSADGVPLIGATSVKGLYLNAGFGHLGWTFAMGAGGLLCDLICGDQPAIDPAPYRPSR